jgi:hypothetical protein
MIIGRLPSPVFDMAVLGDTQELASSSTSRLLV